MAETVNSQVQGAAFEGTLARLLTRLLADELGYEDVSCTLQGSGLQYGKDLRIRWTDEGRAVVWHVECKSHVGKTIPGKEIADKLLDIARSAERIDVWCLASANAEPSPWIHETFAWVDEDLRFPFALTQLTPDQGTLRLLYALDETLFAEQYPTLPVPTIDEDERERILRTFERFLRTHTTHGDAAKLRAAGAWQLVSPATVCTGEDSAGRAALYLKGLVATAPWEAAVHGWATPRTSAVRELARRVDAAAPGLDFVWLVGGGGEGKSTVLRQLAWTVAQRDDRDWYVLSSDRYMREHGTSLPVGFIDRLRDGARVLICLDDSAGVDGGESLRRGGRRVASPRHRRGARRSGSRARMEPQRAAQRPLARDAAGRSSPRSRSPEHRGGGRARQAPGRPVAAARDHDRRSHSAACRVRESQPTTAGRRRADLLPPAVAAALHGPSAARS